MTSFLEKAAGTLPYAADLEAEIATAIEILKDFTEEPASTTAGTTTPTKPVKIPREVMHRAKGIAVLRVVKAGLFWSGRFGSGIVVARLDDGGWSAPSAIGIIGSGFGWQAGAETSVMVLIINTVEALESFSKVSQVTLGGSLQVVAGPVNMTAESNAQVQRGFPAIYSYSRSKGLFAGVSFEGTLILERTDTNYEFYQNAFRASSLLHGEIPSPAEAGELSSLLQERCSMSRTVSLESLELGGEDASSAAEVEEHSE